jgi:hypothetical protein
LSRTDEPNGTRAPQEFYTDERGIQSLTILNEIICEFDELMNQPRFALMEKVKTIGWVYMAAAGLQRDLSEADAARHVCANEMLPCVA